MIVCFFNMGIAEQGIQLVTSTGTKTLGYGIIDDLPWMLVGAYNEYGAEKIQLFGCEAYLENIVEEIKKLEASIARRKGLLSNENYVNKAPANIVEMDRKKLAEEYNVPPYIIFGDKTLEQLVYEKPLSDFELENVYGLAAKKIERYGGQIIKVIEENIQKKTLIYDIKFYTFFIEGNFYGIT